MTAAAVATTAGRRHRSAVAWWWMHPEAPWLVLAAAAWVLLAALHLAEHGASTDPAWRFSLPLWTLMVGAMMVPGVLPMQRRVVFDSLWRRRHRSGAVFVLTYMAVWVAFGAALAAAASLLSAVAGGPFDPGRGAVVVALLAAAGWQRTGAHRRAAHRAHRRLPWAPSGWLADLGLARYGVIHGRACVVACGPIMAAMFLSGHDLHLMVPLTALSLDDRLRRRPNTRATAAALAVLAVLAWWL